jgi:hypothetical protein
MNTPLRILFLFLACLGSVASLRAQWRTDTYDLPNGWSSIYVHGDVPQSTMAELFPSASVVQEVWRWNPPANPIQLGDGGVQTPVSAAANWTKWINGTPQDSKLTRFTGQSAYLIKTNATYTLTLKQRPVPPRSTWVSVGANFLGFPSRNSAASGSPNYPTFNDYFNTFTYALGTATGAYDANNRVYKYIGGALSGSNPTQLSTMTTEKVDRNKAYWFSAPAVGSFIGPIGLTVSPSEGLIFYNTGTSTGALQLSNYRTVATNLTLSLTASETAPTGQPVISSTTPELTLRHRNAANTDDVTLILSQSATQQITLPANSSLTVTVSVNRSVLPAGLSAAILNIRDAGNLQDICLPVSCTKTNRRGLWVGDVQVTNVTKQGSPSQTSKPFPLRFIFVVGDDDRTRLVPQLFMGRLATPGNPLGLCFLESQLHDKASAVRLVSAHLPIGLDTLPLDYVAAGVASAGTRYTAPAGDTGGLAPNTAMIRTVTLPFNNAVNPFVHAYHPDHDNKKPGEVNTLQPEGVESYTLKRVMTFTFDAAPIGDAEYDDSYITGSYSEVISLPPTSGVNGAMTDRIVAAGTFRLNRINRLPLVLP